MSVFIDTSVWFASVVARDRSNASAKTILRGVDRAVTSDHVLVETWTLLASRYRPDVAERFWEHLRNGLADIEIATAADLEAAWAIGSAFHDQDFSLVDRTSFAIMERLRITQAASFDHHFAVYRYGRNRDRAFQIMG